MPGARVDGERTGAASTPKATWWSKARCRGTEVAALNAVLDKLRDANRLASPERYAGIDQRVLHLGFITLNRAFMDLVDHPRLLPKVWGILGPNIYLYSTHLIITPPQTDEFDPARDTLNWHQDSSWMGKDMPELSVPARLSVKVAYFLTDHSQSGSANLWVLPGAHTRSSIDVPPQGEGQPAGAMPVCAPAGSAVIFDRRLWHDGSPNAAPWSRRALFLRLWLPLDSTARHRCNAHCARSCSRRPTRFADSCWTTRVQATSLSSTSGPTRRCVIGCGSTVSLLRV